MTHNEISQIIIDTSIQIHRRLGPGLLESVYAVILAHELRKKGLRVEREVPIPVKWDNLEMEVGFRADMIVEGLVLVELKSVEAISKSFKKVVLTYIRLADKKLGLILNFGAELLKDGISRIVNGLPDEPPVLP